MGQHLQKELLKHPLPSPAASHGEMLPPGKDLTGTARLCETDCETDLWHDPSPLLPQRSHTDPSSPQKSPFCVAVPFQHLMRPRDSSSSTHRGRRCLFAGCLHRAERCPGLRESPAHFPMTRMPAREPAGSPAPLFATHIARQVIHLLFLLRAEKKSQKKSKKKRKTKPPNRPTNPIKNKQRNNQAKGDGEQSPSPKLLLVAPGEMGPGFRALLFPLWVLIPRQGSCGGFSFLVGAELSNLLWMLTRVSKPWRKQWIAPSFFFSFFFFSPLSLSLLQ